jgi:glycerophosphoryl diester phosphodiesterase
MNLPPAFLARPIAHRALHDRQLGRPENSRAAVKAAVEHDYGIEIDLQLSADGIPMVFHDVSLSRLTGHEGPVRNLTASELGRLSLLGGPETIPTFQEVLDLIGGRVPLLVEIKDQDGHMGPHVGPLEEAAASALRGYEGPVAVMSFNPHSMAAMADLMPDLPRGLTTDAYQPENWPNLTRETCDRLRGIPDYERVGASFISHQFNDLSRPRVLELKERGAVILCWTITTPQSERLVRPFADNITFERYLA